MSNLHANTGSTTKKKIKESINELIKLPVRKVFPNEPAKLSWTISPVVTAAELKKKHRALFALISPAERRQKQAEWEAIEKNFVVEEPSLASIEDVTELIDDLNSRARESYDARRVMIVRVLAGDQSEADIEDVRLGTGLSAEKLKQAITTGTTKDASGAVVSNGEAADGILQSTIDFLDQLIQQGKDEAKHRRDVAARNAAIKSGEEEPQLAPSF